jgi:hypothetical protein
MTRLLPERVIREALAAIGDPAWRGSVDLEPVPMPSLEHA